MITDDSGLYNPDMELQKIDLRNFVRSVFPGVCDLCLFLLDYN